MVLTLIHNVFKSFGVVLVAVIFIQVQKSSSQRSSRICTKHWASLKKQNEISLSGMLSFFFCIVEEDSFDRAWDLFVLPYQTQCNAHCHSLWFRSNTWSKFPLRSDVWFRCSRQETLTKLFLPCSGCGSSFPLTLSHNSFHTALYSFIYRPR